MTVQYSTAGVERRSSLSETSKRKCSCACCCCSLIFICVLIFLFRAQIYEIFYDDQLYPECAAKDCSFQARIPGPKLFSTRGQLDVPGGNVFEVKQDYEKDLVIKIAELANFSYEMDPEKSEKWNLDLYNSSFSVQSKHLKIHEMRVFDKSSTDFETYRSVGIIAKTNTRIGQVCIISIRGTETFDDWVVNFNAAEISDGLKALHKNHYYRPFYKKHLLIKQLILDSTHSCDHYVFTGHSQGAAVATISAIELQEQLKNRNNCLFCKKSTVNLVVFASPRPGDDRIAEEAKELDHVFLIENKGDIVPTVPPMIAGFTHIVKTSKFEKPANGSYYLQKNEKWDDAADQLDLGVWNDRLKTWLGSHLEHSMGDGYLRILRQIFYEQDKKNSGRNLVKRANVVESRIRGRGLKSE